MSADAAGSQIGGPGVNPDQQWQLRSQLDFGHKWEWDNTLSYTDNLAALKIPSYVRLDSRLGRHIGENVEVSIVGQNLLSPRRQEFTAGFYPALPTLVQRSVFAKVTWRF